ncbi:ESX secretion-associated protein EspG [Amycolatopsis sp. NPDC001319]|uniref:ESX secretion-associated protein EspG n=1 Tax=unclassified Amycolatopsis TaxID=2618356 RepID=UPI0036796D0C
MFMDEPVTVPRVALARAWEWEKVGPAHPVLGVVEWWLEDDVSGQFDELIRQALAEPGFYDLRRNRLTGEFRDVLWGVSSADAECYRISGDRSGRKSAALAIVTGRSGLLFTVDDDQVTLARISAGRVCQAVVGTLPEVRPAGIAEIAVRRSEYGSSRVADYYDLDVTSDYTVPDPAERLRALMAAPRSAVHQFYVANRTDGVRSSSLPLTVVDTISEGRVLTVLQNGPDGEDVITAGPGSADYISGTLDNTMRGLRA